MDLTLNRFSEEVKARQPAGVLPQRTAGYSAKPHSERGRDGMMERLDCGMIGPAA